MNEGHVGDVGEGLMDFGAGHEGNLFIAIVLDDVAAQLINLAQGGPFIGDGKAGPGNGAGSVLLGESPWPRW